MSNDAVTHLIYTIENAIKSMKSGVTQWVFVIDCTGKLVRNLTFCVYNFGSVKHYSK